MRWRRFAHGHQTTEAVENSIETGSVEGDEKPRTVDVNDNAVAPELATRIYRCGLYEITLPPGHRLPEYQAQHRLYDRFLPHLAAKLDPGSIVVDVGANVGDTYASMVSANGKLRFICVEAQTTFFEYLQSNVNAIASASTGLAPVQLLCAFAGEHAIDGALIMQDGTAKLMAGSANNDSVPYLSLDEILNRCEPEIQDATVVLIKSDVDGYDFNVLRSLHRHEVWGRCLCYFEADPSSTIQDAEFSNIVHALGDKQNMKFCVFDNFGNVIAQQVDANLVCELLAYVRRQRGNATTRTIWYIDILAYPAAFSTMVDAAVKAHLAGLPSVPYMPTVA